MKLIFANSGEFGPPRQTQRALGHPALVLFSYFYMRRWSPEWIRHYVLTGEAMP